MALAIAAPIVLLVVGFLVVRWFWSSPTPGQPDPSLTLASDPTPAPRPPHVVTFEDGCATAECHAAMGRRPYMHATFAQEACDLCHAPDTGGHVYPQLSPTEQTCTSCHDTGAHHRFQHQAMTEDACLACHDPHASEHAALLVGESIEATCVRCHPPRSAPIGHEPYEAGLCTECHDQHGADNPLLIRAGEGEDGCRPCHAPVVGAMEEGAHTHLEVAERCLACHDAHTARHEGLLRAPVGDLCMSCHDDVEHEVSGARVSHDSVTNGRRCLTCHDPHTSEHPSMLRDSQQRVCLSCHAGPVEGPEGRTIQGLGDELEAARLVHGAVTIGECSACHSVHGGGFDGLLRAVNPDVLVGDFDVENYALCFSCHDPQLTETADATQFRDGDRNLHAAHLRANGSSGGCSDCHALHAGNSPRLIVKTLRYQGSDWATPMNFVLTDTGGSCAPACHEQLSYTRPVPARDDDNVGGGP